VVVNEERWHLLGTQVRIALRLLLTTVDEGGRSGPVELPTYGGSGVAPGVDLEDKEALTSLLDAIDDADTGSRRAAG